MTVIWLTIDNTPDWVWTLILIVAGVIVGLLYWLDKARHRYDG